MVQFFTEAEVARLLPMSDAVTAVEEAFRLLGQGKADNRPRARVRIPKLMLHVLSAGSAELGYVGLKSYTTGPGGARFYFQMFDAGSGEMVALMEADNLGQIRTGAASGVASRYLAREDAKRIGIIGTGWQARSQLEAIACVRPIDEILAFGRNEERRESFCREMSEKLQIPVRGCLRAEEAVSGVDIVVTSTNAKQPVLLGAWLEPGQLVNAIGSNQLRRREIDEEAVTRADFITTDSREQAKIECGDLAAVIDDGKLSWEDVHELGDVIAGTDSSPQPERSASDGSRGARARAGEPAAEFADAAGTDRESPQPERSAKRSGVAEREPVPTNPNLRLPAARALIDAIVLFESQGLAIEDVAAAKIVLERGREEGVGRDLGI